MKNPIIELSDIAVVKACCAFSIFMLLLVFVAEVWAQDIDTSTSAAGVVTATTGAEPALAPIIPETPEDALEIVGLLSKAFKSKKWGVFSGWLLLLALGALRFALKNIKDIPKETLMWLGVATSMLVSVSVGLVTEQSWSKILWTGLSVAFVAAGSWSLAEKYAKGALDWLLNKLGAKSSSAS